MTNKEEYKTSLVTIITPVYNGSKTIETSMLSALSQSYNNIELIVINDGSTDETLKIINTVSKQDSRVSIISQSNKGVSAARNAGISVMKGSFFCFLDADDTFPTESITSRMSLFDSDQSLDFVDGFTEFINPVNDEILRTFKPDFKGNPWKDLALLQGKCFCAPTWLIKKNDKQTYAFNEQLTHGEDLTFFMDISKEGQYSYCEESVLRYSQTDDSAMSNLEGLGSFYTHHVTTLNNRSDLVSSEEMKKLKNKVKKIMIKSSLKKKNISLAIKWLRINLNQL